MERRPRSRPTLSQIKGEPAEAKLQIALVEEVLSYSGENGIRLHRWWCVALAARARRICRRCRVKPTTVEHTFDVAAITSEAENVLTNMKGKLPGGRSLARRSRRLIQNLSARGLCAGSTSKKILQLRKCAAKGEGIAAK